MMRYVLFGGLRCYPEGGWDDYISSSNDLTDLVTTAKAQDAHLVEWWNIVDLATVGVVARKEWLLGQVLVADQGKPVDPAP